MGDGLERQSDQLVGTVADHLAERTVHTDEATIERHKRYPNRRLIEREPKLLLGFPAIRCGQLIPWRVSALHSRGAVVG
jgi:hypothetical protein